MYKYLLVFTALLCTMQLHAQNRGALKGRIIDSADTKPVEFVTVAVLIIKDTTTTLHSYTISDKKGEFSLHNLPSGIPLKIFISNVAYKPFRKMVTLDKDKELDMGDVKLGTNQLNEVVITGERPPIVIRKDTIEFNVEAFKTRPNAVVEDLLRKLPGVEVDMRGKITVQGKDVSKVLVDGHEFFSNDYRIATRNVDVDLIDKIQVYDDRDNDPRHLKPKSQLDKIINIKFKKALKRSVFGKVYGGAGTRDRYSAGGLFNYFRDTLQVSLIGIGNNLNGTGFSYSDLALSGGFNRGGTNTFYRGGISIGASDQVYNFDSDNGFAGFQGFGGSDQQRTLSGGVNINQDYGKKLKINVAYFYNNANSQTNYIHNNSQFLADTIFTGSGRNANSQADIKHNISANIEWKPNDTTSLSYRPAFSFNRGNSSSGGMNLSGSNFIPEISSTTDNNTSQNRNVTFEHFFKYDHSFKKQGESIGISHTLSLNPDTRNGFMFEDLTSYTNKLAPYRLDRAENNDAMNKMVNLSVNYRYPLTKKLIGVADLYLEYNHHKNDNNVFNRDSVTGNYDIFLTAAGSTITRNFFTQGLNPALTYNFTDEIRLTATANIKLQQTTDKFGRGTADVGRNFSWLLPSVSFTYHDYSLSYQANYNLPNVEDMKPYSVIYNPRYIDYGNTDLKPTRVDAFTLSYSKNFEKSGLNIYGDLGTNIEHNSVFRHQTIDGVGNTTSAPINMNGKFAITSNTVVDKDFDINTDLSIKSHTGIGLRRSRSYFEVNNQNGFQNNYSYSLKQEFAITWKDIIQLEEGYRLNSSTVKYTGIDYNNVSYLTHVINSHLILTLPKVLNIESTYAYVYSPIAGPGLRRSSNLLNISVARLFMAKDRAEVKLSCYDILNQNVSQYRSVNGNSVFDWQTQILRRYFLLTLQFKFNKTISKGE